MRMLRLASLAVLALALLPRDARAQETDPDLFIAQSVEGLRALTGANAAAWRLGEEDDIAVNQNTGTITFRFADGTMATAPVQIVGTYDPEDGSFLWGWDHPSVLEPLRAHAALVREFGERYGIARLTERRVQITQDEAWELTALAARLGEASGAYRAVTGGPLVYMTFGAVTLQRP